MRTTSTPLGNVVLALARHGIRQVDIAARYPCSPGFVNKVIRGRFPPPARFREVVAELTGLPEGELFPEPRRSSGLRETAEARAAEITARYLALDETNEPTRQPPYADLAVDLSPVLRRLRRGTARARGRSPNDPTVRALIGAGMRLLDRELGDTTPPADLERRSPPRVLDWLSVERVLHELRHGPAHLPQDSSVGAVRNRWDWHAAFIADLVAYALRYDPHVGPGREPLADRVEQLMAAPAAAPAAGPGSSVSAFVDSVHAIAYWDLRTLLEMPAAPLRFVAAAAAGRHAELRAALRSHYQDRRSFWQPVYERLLRAHGLRLREGVTLDDLTLILSAAADGLALRLRADPDAPVMDHQRQRSLLGTLALALIASCTEPIGDPQGQGRTLEQVVQAPLHEQDPSRDG